jgi:hypothetical protein
MLSTFEDDVVNQFYDIPRALKRKCLRGSEAIRLFYHHFFIDSYGLTRGEVDLCFLNKLTSDELSVARQLVRLNLHLRYTHIIEATAELRDIDAIPALREMYDTETDLSRRLTIAGSLWKLTRDQCFIECINELVACKSNTMKEAHIDQILWLGDTRSIYFLVQLLDDPGQFVRSLALSRLNEIEHGEFFLGKPLPTAADEYRIRSSDHEFVNSMVKRLGKLERNGG